MLGELLNGLQDESELDNNMLDINELHHLYMYLIFHVYRMFLLNSSLSMLSLKMYGFSAVM